MTWLVRSTPERAVWFRVLPGTLCCVFVQDTFTLAVPLSTQVYKGVTASLHSTETGISSGLMGHLARIQNLPP